MEKKEVTVREAKQLWKQLFGWRAGDRCTMKGVTKTLHGTVHEVSHVTVVRGDESWDIPTVIVDWDTRSPIPQRQSIPPNLLEVE